ncbi:hypothetical protein BC828DRAFT_227817 [Blastocladiella britannica]|nr:hypothetical protein BC828DRAFT_227817 [Blastocladiella britannica]
MSSRPPSLLPQLPSSTVARPPGIGGSSANPQPPLSPLQPLSNNNNVSRRASSRPIPGGGEVSSLPPPTSSFDLLTSKDPPTTATSPLTPRMIGGGGGGGAGGMRSTAGSRTSSSSRLLQSTTSAAVSDGTSRDGDVGSRSAVVAAASGTMTPNSPLGGIRTGMRAPISRTSSSGQVLSPIGSGATSVTSSAGDTFVTAPPPLLPLLGQQSPPPVSPSSRKSPLASMMPLDGGPVRPRSPPSSSASSASESESPRSSSRYSSAARSRSPSGNTTTAITSAASGGRYGRASPLQAIAILPRGSLVTDDPGSVSGIETDGEGGDDGEQDPVPEGNVLMHAMVAAKNLIQYGGGKQTMSVNDEIRELQHLSHIRLDRLGLVAVEYLSTTLTHITNLTRSPRPPA